MRYGVESGTPRRFAFGASDNFAQSRGECPGVSPTFNLGLGGIELWVGGGAREKLPPRFGAGDRDGGDAE